MYSPFRYDCVYAYQHSDKKKYLMFAYNEEHHKDLIIPITDAPWFCDPGPGWSTSEREREVNDDYFKATLFRV